jgi:hypothetical protein
VLSWPIPQFFFIRFVFLGEFMLLKIHWFLKLWKQSQHWLSLITKTTSNLLVSKTSKTIPTLTFTHCESNSISLVFEYFRNNPKIGFHSLRKQLNFLDMWILLKLSQHLISLITKVTQIHLFSKLQNNPNIGFRLLQKQLNFIGFRLLQNQSQHCLLLIMKTTQIHWFLKLWDNPNIRFRSLWK